MIEALAWIILVLTTLGMAAGVLLIGRPREPITPTGALLTIVIGALQVAVCLAVIAR